MENSQCKNPSDTRDNDVSLLRIELDTTHAAQETERTTLEDSMTRPHRDQAAIHKPKDNLIQSSPLYLSICIIPVRLAFHLCEVRLIYYIYIYIGLSYRVAYLLI
jgi:hypothetical protein